MANIIPAASAEFETAGDTGDWNFWFGGGSIAQTTDEANNGTGSMAATAGTNLAINNGGGWSAAPGVHLLSAAVKGPAGATFTFDFQWQDGPFGAALGVGTVTIVTDGVGWVTDSVESTAPAGTANLRGEITTGGSATNGLTYHIDSISADDNPVSGVTGTGDRLAASLGGTGSGVKRADGSGDRLASSLDGTGSGVKRAAGAGDALTLSLSGDGSGTKRAAGSGDRLASSLAGVGSGTGTVTPKGSGEPLIAALGGVGAGVKRAGGTGNRLAVELAGVGESSLKRDITLTVALVPSEWFGSLETPLWLATLEPAVWTAAVEPEEWKVSAAFVDDAGKVDKMLATSKEYVKATVTPGKDASGNPIDISADVVKMIVSVTAPDEAAWTAASAAAWIGTPDPATGKLTARLLVQPSALGLSANAKPGVYVRVVDNPEVVDLKAGQLQIQ